MVFMALSGEIQGSENTPPWMDRKRSSFPYLTVTENTNWETVIMHMSLAEEAIRKATGRFNTPVDCWGCINSPIYHVHRFTLTETAPTRVTQALLNVKTTELKSMLNVIP